MADESAEFEFLTVPSEAKDLNSGRCRVSPKLIAKIGGILNSPVKIETEFCSVLCTLWPRNDEQEKVIQYDSFVTVPCSKKIGRSGKHILLKNITLTDPLEATKVVIELILSNPVDDIQADRTQFAQDTTREKVVQRLLRGCVVVKGCVIKPREFRNNVNPFKGIDKVLVLSTEPFTHSAEDKPVLIDERTKITFKSIKRGEILRGNEVKIPAGYDDVARDLREILSYPFLYPDCFNQLALECPKGILLQGAPGVGKTLLVKTVASQCNAQLVTLSGTDIFGPHPGESEENLRKTFERARNASNYGPCVLFVDELDALCPKRGNGGSEQESRIVAQLLTLLDGLEPRGQLVIIGATNRPHAIDPALRRPGRLDREVVIGVPDVLQRLSILYEHTRSMKLSSDVDLAHLAEQTLGYVGADIASLCREAGFITLKRTVSHRDNELGLDSSNVQATSKGNLSAVTMDDFQLAVCHTVPSLYRGSEGMVELPPVNWDDIGGLEPVKLVLKQAIEWPLKYPESFVRLGLKRPRGVLLYGPPGCCKTTLVRAAAASCQCAFMALSCAQLFSPYVGDAERKIRELFTKARATAPCILFFDELDAIVGKRSGSSSTGVEGHLLSTLLNEMDGVGLLANIYQSDERSASYQGSSGESWSEQFECKQILDESKRLKFMTSLSVKDIVIVAATNRPHAIDEALLRPGRIDRLVYVPSPDLEARLEILKVHTRATPLGDEVDLEELSVATELFSGADLENLCREAALYALEDKGMSVSKVEHEHFKSALSTIRPSLTREQLDAYKLTSR
ncbi:ATPase family gene 2 protein homolog B-like isoform X2 [Montipora capricornis]|uniref:ATPase family gene 2 protein homolog B-like isoform X2 n=1 Tax=Montipora capricornis TaxID=246305 RepID=UPI0035F0FF88